MRDPDVTKFVSNAGRRGPAWDYPPARRAAPTLATLLEAARGDGRSEVDVSIRLRLTLPVSILDDREALLRLNLCNAGLHVLCDRFGARSRPSRRRPRPRGG